MPYQTVTGLHDDGYLNNIAVQYMNQPNRLIADKICPMVPVQKENDKFVTFEKGSWYRRKAAMVPDGDPVPIGDYGVSSTSYECAEYGLASAITERSAANADAVMRLSVNKTKFVAQHTMLERELQCAALMFNESLTLPWGTGAVTSGVWSDANTSKPVNDIYQAIDFVEDATFGFRANTIVVPKSLFRELQINEQIVAALYGPGGSGPTRVTADLLADFFDVDNFLVGYGVYTTVQESATDITKANQTDIWGSTLVGAYYISPTPSLDVPSAAYRFQTKVNTRTWNDIERRRMVIENTEVAVQKQVAPDCGYLLTGV